MSEMLTAEQVKAARALLTWSQAELAAEARVATSTVADFERGTRKPMPNNAQSMREAFETKGLQFVAGGVVEKSMLPQPAPRPGALVRWITATDLAQWGERRDGGQSRMPELVRRLIYAAHGPVASVHFPSDDSVQLPGWDGTCSVAVGSEYVPSGVSGWEIGAQRAGIRGKADSDFKKRTNDPEGLDQSVSTFVFVTPQRFANKDAWIAEKKALGEWKDVVVIDADRLVHWLELNPAVAQWLSVKMRRQPEGLRNMEDVWAEWQRATKTPLKPEVLLTDRDDDHMRVLKWLRAPAQLLSIQAEAPEEAMAFLYAAISPLPEPYRLAYLGRCVVADTVETARQLIGLGTPLIIVMTTPDAGVVQRLVEDGHHVFEALGSEASAPYEIRRLAHPWRYNLQLALVNSDLSEEEAHRLAHASGRSITVLRRLMPASPSYQPAWAKEPPAELIAAMFAGAWVDNNPKDRKLLSELAGCSYDQIEAVLASLAATLGGPIVRVGNVWKIVSLRDVWTQIGSQVTPTQFTRFEKVFQRVLGVVNPRYSTRPKSAYYEEEGEFGEEASGVLRKGLTEALIAPAVYPGQATLINEITTRVNNTVHQLLNNAGPDLWWSLSRDFQNISEASPNAFLNALEAAMEGDEAPALSLFRSDEGVFHPTEYLSNLLWSLETLARSAEYLPRVVLILARLHEVDPGGKWSNRPFASLRRIFVTWSPQTYAGPSHRLKAIDLVMRRHPSVGWKLLVALAPKPHDTSEPSAKPNWRDFTPDEPEVLTWDTVFATTRTIGNQLLDHAGDDVCRWLTLIGMWSNFDAEWRADAILKLDSFSRTLTSPDQIEAMRDALRDVVETHRGFKDAEWAMPEDQLQPLDQIVDILQPVGLEDRVRWLFRQGAMKLRPGMDYKVQQNELESQQMHAAAELVDALSTDAIFEFSKTITMHHALGVAIAKSPASADTKLSLMKRALTSIDVDMFTFGNGMLWGSKVAAGKDGEVWVRHLWDQATAEEWAQQGIVQILLALPCQQATWDEIDSRSPALANAYWKNVSDYLIPSDTDPTYVAERLLAVGRGYAAVEWFGGNIATNPPGTVMVNVLKEAAKSAAPADQNSAVMLGHWLGIILDFLENASDVSDKDVVSLEWTYFQALRYSQRPPRTLHRALARDPQFFVYLMKLIYLPAESSGMQEAVSTDPEAARNLAGQAYDVLHDWSLVPGSDDQGIINALALEDWIKVARKLLSESGRGEIGDAKIGAILAAATRESGKPWPPEPVREIIEVVRSRALEDGFVTGVYNLRGVTVRAPHEGGVQERALAQRYKADAEDLRYDWPRTAGCLDRVASTYEADASHEDLSADQRDWL